MNWPIILTGIYAIVIAAFQYILASAMPHMGMGGMAMIYFVWPLLAVSVVVLYFILRRCNGSGLTIMIPATLLACFLSLWVYPQDSPVSLPEKVNKVASWISSR